MDKTYLTTSKEQTRLLGEKMAPHFLPGDVVLLKGDLGAGKTTFTGGVAKGLEIDEAVISPTFNIMKCYFRGRLPLYHIDAYRLEDQPIEIGLDEFIEGDGVCLIEWPQYIDSLLPEEYLEIAITHEGGDERKIVLRGFGRHYEDIIKALPEVLA